MYYIKIRQGVKILWHRCNASGGPRDSDSLLHSLSSNPESSTKFRVSLFFSFPSFLLDIRKKTRESGIFSFYTKMKNQILYKPCSISCKICGGLSSTAHPATHTNKINNKNIFFTNIRYS